MGGKHPVICDSIMCNPTQQLDSLMLQHSSFPTTIVTHRNISTDSWKKLHVSVFEFLANIPHLY